MQRKWFWIGSAVAVGGAILLLTRRDTPEHALFEPKIQQIEAAPLCPWREPDADLQRFFPGATNYVTQTRILSGQRLALAQRLGRPLDPEENTLTVHAVLSASNQVGSVMIRRVKGEHGAIEIVLSINPRGETIGVRLQRLREPDSIAGQLQNTNWLNRFKHRTYDRGWASNDLAGMTVEAQTSASAIREGIRSLLILHSVEQPHQN